MLSGKILFTVIALTVAVAAVMNMNVVGSKPVVENWWSAGQFSYRYVPGMRDRQGNETAFSGNYFDPNAMMGSNKFVSVPSFQGVLSPRFSNVQYGANIRYNMPDRKNLASPCDPLTFGDVSNKEGFSQSRGGDVPKLRSFPGSFSPQEGFRHNSSSSPSSSQPRENYKPMGSCSPGGNGGNGGGVTPNAYSGSRENYCANCGTGQCGGGCPASCGKGGYGVGHAINNAYELPSGYTNGNFQDVYDSLPANGQNLGSDLPSGDIATINQLGESEQFIAFNRIMPANTMAASRLRAQGDPIRGDLAIVPCQSGWFSVYPDIARDLQQGAINVLAGTDAGVGSESYSKLMKLVTSAGPAKTFGGVDLNESLPMYNPNMATQQVTTLRAGMSDVNVTAFP